MVRAANRAEDLPSLLSDTEYLMREKHLSLVEAYAQNL